MALKLKIVQGSTFTKSFRWECEPFIYKPITGVSNNAPCELTCTGHGLLSDRLFAVQSVKGMKEINTKDISDLSSWYRATVVDADHIQINRVNSLDFSKYESGGVIQYRTLVDLTGYKCRMMFRTKVGGELLYTANTELGNITIDPATGIIRLTIPALDTEKFDFKKAVFDIEMVSPSGDVTPIMQGEVQVTKEVTTA